MVSLAAARVQFVEIGRVSGIELNKEERKDAKKGDEVAIKIERDLNGPAITYGRQFDLTNQLYSKVYLDCLAIRKLFQLIRLPSLPC